MTSRLRSSTSIPKERSKATYHASDTFYYEPEESTDKSYGKTKQDNSYRFDDFRGACAESNGRRFGDEETAEDPDLLYKRSKDRFGSWDIRDIAGNSQRRLRDGKLERTFIETSKNNLVPREDERNGSRRSNDVVDKIEKEKHLESARNGSFLGESLKIRRNGESQKKASFQGITVPVTEDRRIIVDPTIDRARTREENEDEDDPRRHRHRHRRRHRYIFDGTSGEDRCIEDVTRENEEGKNEEINRGIDRRRSRSVEKVSRSYEHFIVDKDSSTFRGEDQRIPRFAVDDIDRESDHDIDREEDPAMEHEENDPRGDKENLIMKNNRYVVDTNRNRSISKDVQEAEGTGLEDNARRARRPFVYANQSTEEFDVRIQRYERALPELGKDSNSSKKGVSRALDRSPSKRDSSKEHDREATRRISFNDVNVSCKQDTESITTRKPSFKEQDNGIRLRSLNKNDQAGGIKCTIKSRSNETTEKNCFRDENTDLRRKCSFKEQRPELGKISFQTHDGETEQRSSLRDDHRHAPDRIFLKVDTEDERKRAFRYESPSAFEKVSRENQKLQAVTSNEKKTNESVNRRRRISFKDRDIDRSERRSSYIDKDSNMEETRRKSDWVFDDRFENSEFDKNDSTSRDKSGRYRWKKTIDSDRDDIDSRAHFSRERAPSPEKKYERRSGALTPPKGRRGRGGGEIKENEEEEKDLTRSNEAWREENRLFAMRYLRENGRAAIRKGSMDDEDDRDNEVEPDVAEVRSIAINGSQDRANNRIEHDTRGRIASTIERNGTTIVRILTGSGEATNSRGDVERRRYRRPVQQELDLGHRRRRFDASRYDSEEETARGEMVRVKEETRKEHEQVQNHEEEEEEEDERRRDNNDAIDYRQESRRGSRRNDGLMPGIAGPTPSRRLWNYREGGVLITDVEEGQPCLQCGEACPGFSPHIWRKNCTSCKCPREDHDVCHEEWASVRSRLGLKVDESSSPLGFSDPRERGLAWAPPGLPPHKVDEYFSMLPEISVPRLGTPGERYRDRQLAFQLPKQDLARAYCRYLDPKHASSADDFMAARNEIALDIGTVQEVVEESSYCGTCQEPLKYGSLAVSASKLELLYHPACFRCTDCKELLVDLAYCVHEDTIFCERHYAEQLKPRCSACDELIFSGEYTKAMNKDWHSGHFCCWQCDESLTGQRYVLRDEHPYCIKCYESIFANGCEECNKIIGIDSKDLSYKDKHWHEACFLCNRCRVSLVDKQFGSKVDKIYCGNCYDAQFASRCDGCGEIFRAGTKKMEYKTRQWHEKCFCCVVCKNPIGTKSFIPREQEIYCASCYEDKFATRCVKCNKIITSGGVTYKNEPWHRDCFTCSHCNNSLAGQRFTSRDDKPYCADCFGELFAKRCTACSKPITGIGGTRFISFEDRHWHNECFICAGCKTSLVGRGFITDGDDIICPECAKAKLM